MKFNDFLKEEEDEKEDGVSAPVATQDPGSPGDLPEEELSNEPEDEDVEEEETVEDEDETEDEEVSDELTSRISDLLPKVLSGTFKTLEEVVIPINTFLENSELTKDELVYWIDNSQEVYPNLTHELELDEDNDKIIIRELGVEEEDFDDEQDYNDDEDFDTEDGSDEIDDEEFEEDLEEDLEEDEEDEDEEK